MMKERYEILADVKIKKKLIHNNYQFYEQRALANFLDQQNEAGNQFVGTVGQFLNILKFQASKNNKKSKYRIFKKHLDVDINEALKSRVDKIRYQNNLYVIYEDEVETNETHQNLELIEARQNSLMSLSVKKAMYSVMGLVFLSIILLVLRILLINIGSVSMNVLNVGISLTLLITFLVYFLGDFNDYIKGYGVIEKGKLLFNNRSPFKNRMFCLGDVLLISVFLLSIFTSIFLAIRSENIVFHLEIFRVWFIIFAVGFISYIKYHRSYFSLLLIETVLLITCFGNGIFL